MLQERFHCSSKTVAAARAHALLFGKGGSSKDGITFTRQVVSPEVVDEFYQFINQDNISRPSSCRSVLVEGKETGVRYWQCSIKEVVQQYLLKFPDGVKRTFIYTHLPANFKMDTMLAGLCNICDEYGHENFASLRELLGEIKTSTTIAFDVPALQGRVHQYQKFMKTTFVQQVNRHSSCTELCLDYALDACDEEHPDCSSDVDNYYQICTEVREAVNGVAQPEIKQALQKKLDEFSANHNEYRAHLLRTKHQAEYYRFVLKNLQPGQAVVIVDYKMKLEMGSRLRENQREWYGKRGISLHGFFLVAQVSASDRRCEVIDLWSEDTKQDSWFTQSALDICFHWLESVYPKYSVFLFSDNGPHYHNTGVLTFLGEVNSKFDFTLVEYNYFEAGEGKSTLDTHFAHVSHKIIRWVRVGNDLESGEQLAELIKSMKNVSCKKLLIDRSKAPKKLGTFKNISLFGSFGFPLEGSYTGGILAQSVAGRGSVVSKTKAQMLQIACRKEPIAGATGAFAGDDEPTHETADATHLPSSTSYTVKFLQHAPDDVDQELPLTPLQEIDKFAAQRPDKGHALKRGGAKRTVFSEAQKEVMLYLYNRQAVEKIMADPKDAIKIMKDSGLEPLTVTQIRSWWSTHHRKRQQQGQMQIINTSLVPGAGRENQQPHVPVPTVMPSNQQQSDPNANQPRQPLYLLGTGSQHGSSIIEWRFDEDFSQSTLQGRMGSNACTFIALYMGKLVRQNNLAFPNEKQLSPTWKDALEEAMTVGNNIHDEMFDQDATDVAVDEAIEIAGEQCGVKELGQEFGSYQKRGAKRAIMKAFQDMSDRSQTTSSVLTMCGRTVLFLTETTGAMLLVDSHVHQIEHYGAVILLAPKGKAADLVKWFEETIYINWQYQLDAFSLNEVLYRV